MAGPKNTQGNCINDYCEIPARTFFMGSPEGTPNTDADEHPQRAITLPTRWLRRTEVTVGEYKAHLAKNSPDVDLKVVLSGCGSLEPNQLVVKGRQGEGEQSLLKRAREIAGQASCSVDNLKVERQAKSGLSMNGYCGEMNSRGDDYPVVCVDQKEAEDFCEKEGATLPTEALIENASHGTSGNDEYGNPIDKAVIWTNGFKATEPPCGANNEREGPFGVCDLAGNVWERTSTKYDPKSYETMSVVDPNSPLTGAKDETVVFRGGSFDGDQRGARAGNRYDGNPGLRCDDVGFRCGRSSAPGLPKK